MRTMRKRCCGKLGNPAVSAAAINRRRMRLRLTADFSVFPETMIAKREASSQAGMPRKTKKGVVIFAPFWKIIAKFFVRRCGFGSMEVLKYQTESFTRPLLRRAEMTLRPPGVRMRERKPWTLLRRRFLVLPIIVFLKNVKR